jgi:hypothetical protein
LRKPASSPGYIEKPIFMIGAPNLAPAPAMRKSQAQAISSPPPTQGPRIAATVGMRAGFDRRQRLAHRLVVGQSQLSTVARAVLNSSRSPPAAKAAPSPRRITQRSESSAASACIVSRRRHHIRALSALSLSGLNRVTVATAPSRWQRMSDSTVSLSRAFAWHGCLSPV